MVEGLSKEMMEYAVQGKSPICAIERRLANGKMVTFNIAK